MSTADAVPRSRGALNEAEASLSRRYRQFERTLLQMAEYLRKTEPERADLLIRAIGKSKEDRVGLQMDQIMDLLEERAARRRDRPPGTSGLQSQGAVGAPAERGSPASARGGEKMARIGAPGDRQAFRPRERAAQSDREGGASWARWPSGRRKSAAIPNRSWKRSTSRTRPRTLEQPKRDPIGQTNRRAGQVRQRRATKRTTPTSRTTRIQTDDKTKRRKAKTAIQPKVGQEAVRRKPSSKGKDEKSRRDQQSKSKPGDQKKQESEEIQKTAAKKPSEQQPNDSQQERRQARRRIPLGPIGERFLAAATGTERPPAARRSNRPAVPCSRRKRS